MTYIYIWTSTRSYATCSVSRSSMVWSRTITEILLSTRRLTAEGTGTSSATAAWVANESSCKKFVDGPAGCGGPCSLFLVACHVRSLSYKSIEVDTQRNRIRCDAAKEGRPSVHIPGTASPSTDFRRNGETYTEHKHQLEFQIITSRARRKSGWRSRKISLQPSYTRVMIAPGQEQARRQHAARKGSCKLIALLSS